MTEITGLSTTDSSNTEVTGESIDGAIANMGRMDNTLQAILGLLARSIRTNVLRFLDNSDDTKRVALDLSGITTATTRTWTAPNKSGTLAMTSDLGSGPIASNLALAASVASNALTISIKGFDGNDPSASNVVSVPFRSATASSGDMDTLSITAATSFVISSGSTMGFANATAGRLWIVGFNDGGTFRLGAVNCRSGTTIMSLRDSIYSATAEGGAGGADSAQVIYAGAAVSAKPLCVLGFMEWSSGLTTAGTWSIVPTNIQVRTASSYLPGDIVQSAFNWSGALINSAIPTPADNTIPQNTEGAQAINQAITPTSAANLLHAFSTLFVGAAATDNVTAAMFRDSIVDAVAATGSTTFNAGSTLSLPLDYWMMAGTTSSVDFKVRAGAAASNVSINGANGGQRYGGVGNTSITVQEIMA